MCGNVNHLMQNLFLIVNFCFVPLHITFIWDFKIHYVQLLGLKIHWIGTKSTLRWIGIKNTLRWVGILRRKIGILVWIVQNRTHITRLIN